MNTYKKQGEGGALTPTPPPVIPNPLAPFASGVRDLLFSEERQAKARRYVTAARDGRERCDGGGVT